jgi:hypothetical protein
VEAPLPDPRARRPQALILKDLPPIPKGDPQATPEEAQRRVLDLSLANPTRGCNYLSAQLALEGISLPAVTPRTS